MHVPPGRRAVLVAGLLSLGAAAAGCSTAPSSSPSSPAGSAPASTVRASGAPSAAAPVPAGELAVRAVAAMGDARTASLLVRRSPGFVRWTATGHVRYSADGAAEALVTVSTGQPPDIEIHSFGTVLYLRRADTQGAWGRMHALDTLPPQTQVVMSEIIDSLLLLGPAGRVPEASFRDVSPGSGGTDWTSALSASDWAHGLPAPRQERFQVASGMNVQLSLDAQGRPARRTDFLLPNDLEMTVETIWSGWGAPFTMPPRPTA